MRQHFGRIAATISRWVGSPSAVLVALAAVAIGLAVVGVDLVNISISVVTMLLALVIQATQNKDSAALHAKLDALIGAADEADDNLARIEDQTEEEIEAVRPS